MTGSLQIKKGYYYIILNLRDENGKSKPKWIATGLLEKGNKRRADQLLRDTIAEYESKNDIVDTKKIPFYKFMEDWLDVIKTQVEPITYNGYKHIVENQIVPYFKSQKISLQDLQTIHIQKFYSKRLKDGKSGNTIKHYHANLHKALNYAVKIRFISYNPASLVELPKKEKYVGSTYNESQIKQLIELVKGTEIETAILLAVSYGLRRSEIIGLKWNAIDFDRMTVEIKHTVTGGGKNLICADKTKNKSSYRTLPLINGLDKYLLQLKQRQQEMKLFMGQAYIDSDYVCRWDDGKLIMPNHLSKKFKTIINANSLPVIRFHDLRHTAASMLIAEGFNLKQVSEFLGHCDIGTTANIYAHLQFQSKIDMGTRMSERLFA